MSIHLLNTFLLLAAVAMTAHWAGMKNPVLRRGSGGARWLSLIAVIVLTVLGASGAVTALGDTLFPSQSLAQGLAQDFSPSRHFLLGLRIYHPLIALAVSLYLCLYARWVIRSRRGQVSVVLPATLLLVLLCAQLLVGVLNVLLLAPIFIQMIHLFIGDLIWIDLIFLISRIFVHDDAAAVTV
jgi:heme A synthase